MWFGYPGNLCCLKMLAISWRWSTWWSTCLRRGAARHPTYLWKSINVQIQIFRILTWERNVGNVAFWFDGSLWMAIMLVPRYGPQRLQHLSIQRLHCYCQFSGLERKDLFLGPHPGLQSFRGGFDITIKCCHWLSVSIHARGSSWLTSQRWKHGPSAHGMWIPSPPCLSGWRSHRRLRQRPAWKRWATL